MPRSDHGFTKLAPVDRDDEKTATGESQLPDIFLGDGAMNTLIVGQGTVEDHGVELSPL